jgi:hypothetical protein
VLASETLGHLEGQVEERAVVEVLDRLPAISAAGVRVVPGGAGHT